MAIAALSAEDPERRLTVLRTLFTHLQNFLARDKRDLAILLPAYNLSLPFRDAG